MMRDETLAARLFRRLLNLRVPVDYSGSDKLVTVKTNRHVIHVVCKENHVVAYPYIVKPNELLKVLPRMSWKKRNTTDIAHWVVRFLA
jgi:hypothetical protein